MKNLIKYLMVLQLGFSMAFGQIAWGQQTVTVNGQSYTVDQATADYQKDLQTAIYSVQEIPAILKDLSGMDTAAGYAITDNVAKDIYLRFDTAVSLMSLIFLDKKLDEKQKYEMTEDLAAALGEVFFTVIRQHGQDKVDAEKFVKRLNEMTTLDHAKEVLREFLFDGTFLLRSESAEFKNRADAGKLKPDQNGKVKEQTGAKHVKIFRVEERLNRNQLSLQLTERMKNYSQTVYPQLEDGKLEKVDRAYWAEDVFDKAVRLREYRVKAQRFTAMTYLGFAFWGFVAPHVDVVGPFTGYNDNTLFTSSLIYATGWTIIGATKMALTSTKVVKALKDTMALFKDPKLATTVGTTDGVSSQPVKMNFRQKLALVSRNFVQSCKAILGMGSKK